mgnify:CR=1 FL=1
MIKEIGAGAGIGLALFLLLQGYNIFPVVFLLGLVYLLSQTVGLKNLRRKFSTVVDRTRVARVSFDEIGGQDFAKQELIEALEFITKHQQYKSLGIRPLKGILLTGPPGTGKTLLAKAAASYTDSVFISSSGSEFIEMYAGVGAQRVRSLFRRARETARQKGKDSAIIFIDELEVLGGKRGRHTSHLEYDQTLNQLLVEMDGLSIEDDVIILLIGATNRPDLLDDALTRPGRFDRIVRVDLPDKKGRQEILKLHTANKPLDDKVDLEQVARETFGFSGAHLESLANEAAILAMREGKKVIEPSHFSEAIDKVMMGEKLERRPSAGELERIAVHEGGHALVAESERPGYVSSINITSRGKALGYVRNTPVEDTYLQTRENLEEDIRLALAGSVAEEELLGSRSTGAINDFEKAVGLARRMVLSGMSRLGVVDEDIVPDQELYQVVSSIIREEEEKVRNIISRHRSFLRKIAWILVDKEAVSGAEFRRLFKEEGFEEAEEVKAQAG